MCSALSNLRKKLDSAYFRMLRSILGVKIRNKIKLSTVLEKSRTKRVGWFVKKLKMGFAGHLVRGKEKWGKITIEWWTRHLKRNKGRPPTLCRNELERDFGLFWGRAGRDRAHWKKVMKAYARTRADSTAV